MKFNFFLVLILMLIGCNKPGFSNKNSQNRSELIDEIRSKTLYELKVEKELYPCGFGAGGRDQLNMLAISFNYYRDLDVEKARELLMFAGRLFLKNINDSENMRLYLTKGVFNSKNIEIVIYLKEANVSESKNGSLAVIALTDGKLQYNARRKEDGKLSLIYEETFDDASSKINAARTP